MKSTRFTFLMLATIAMLTIFSSSCGNGKQGDAIFGVTNVLKRIPSDAVAVTVVNVGQIMNKLDYNEFKKTDLFKRMLSEAKNDLAKQILENPESSGIATNGQFCMYVDVKGKEDYTVGILLPVKNVKDLEALFDKSAKEKADSPFKKIESTKEYKFVQSKEKEMNVGIAWDKKMLVMTISSQASATEILANLFDTKRKESILTNKNFKAEKAEGHDFMFWMQSDPIVKIAKADKDVAKTLKQISFLGLTEEALDGNTVSLFYDFEKGKMEGGLSYKMNKEIEKEYGGIFKNKIGTDFSKYFPKKHLSGLTIIGLDTKGIQEVLKNRSFDGLVNQQLSEIGLSLDDLVKGLNGEIAIGSYVDPAAENALQAQKVVVAIAFEKPELLDKLLALTGEMGVGQIKKEGSRYVSAASKEAQGLMDKKVFVLSNDLTILDQIEKGGFKGAEAIEKEHYADMSKGWMSGHIDYGQLLATLEDMPSGAMMGGMMGLGKAVKMLNQYNELESTTAVVSTEEAKVTVHLKNKSENSLKTLSKSADKMYIDRAKIKKQMEELEEGKDRYESDEDEKKKDM